MSEEGQEKEVLYSEGATSLFLAIEETDWRHALDLAEEHPEQVRTWVRSAGTENTTFTWSMWRRLPIHEACRRQAPAWLVASLLSIYPEAANLITQFGELPLHLAVESGAAPEVVNLVLVANWSGIVTRDNSGRAPMDIMAQGGELLLVDDNNRIVYESLMRCHKTYVDIQQKVQDEKTELKRKHNGQVTTLQRQHQEVLKQETEKSNLLMMHLEARELEIEQMKKIDEAKDTLLLEAHNEIASWKREVQALTTTITKLQEELANDIEHIDALEQELQEREKDIDGRDEFIECLSNDLRTISAIHEKDISESVLASEKAMRAMVSSQIVLQKHLSEQASNLSSLLRIRGIERPPEQKSDSINNGQEEKDEHPNDCGEVAASLKAAAMAALKPSTTC